MAGVSSAGEIRDTELETALGERYLSYALSTIMARSLPDVRDGLKPVHRRLLWAMRELRLDPASAPRKCAKVVGDVMGNYHPHGDASIYDALVRLAQDFAQRYPLIEGQGNFGNIDGDNAAAMRYTESRLTAVAQALMAEIDADTVDFRESYDGRMEEPVVLPAAFPNLLANGSSGIAVGMATSIPPHNVSELADGLRLLIDNPACSLDELLTHVRGPDFPTGGVLVETPENIREAYAAGRGSFRLRARWIEEILPLGAYQLVVTEIPYQVPKARLVERIAQLLEDKKLPLLGDMREESDAAVRLVFEPKSRNVDPDTLMESLYRTTDLEIRVPLNLNVLDAAGVPRVMPLPDAMRAYLDHRLKVLERRSRSRRAAIETRLRVLAGYLVAYLNIDEVIRIVRFEDHPKPALIQRFEITEEQAEAILNLRLRALHKLEQLSIEQEQATLQAELDAIDRLLADPGKRWAAIDREIVELKRQFGNETELGRRRTELGPPPGDVIVPVHALVEREPATVLCSEKGWIRVAKGHNVAVAEQRWKEGDGPRFAIECQTTDRVLVFASTGRFYTLSVDRLPGGRGTGEPLKLMIDLPNDAEIKALMPFRPGIKLLLLSTDGRGFAVPSEEALAQTRAGKQVMVPAANAKAEWCLALTGDAVGLLGQNRKLLVVPVAEIPEMVRGRGVIMQKYKDGGLADARVLNLAQGIAWQSGSRTRSEPNLHQWQTGRASGGRSAPMGFPQKPVRFP